MIKIWDKHILNWPVQKSAKLSLFSYVHIRKLWSDLVMKLFINEHIDYVLSKRIL